MIELIIDYQDAYYRGLKGTLKLASLSWLIGLSLGGVLGTLGFLKMRMISTVSQLINFILTSIPVVVILFWFHYPAQNILGLNISPFYTSLFVIATINTFAISVIVGHGFKQIRGEYIELAKLYGISETKIIIKILFPMMARNIAPSIITLQMFILHMTLFASLISYEELFRVSLQINSVAYKPVEVFSILAGFFFLISTPFLYFSYQLKKNKWARNVKSK